MVNAYFLFFEIHELVAMRGFIKKSTLPLTLVPSNTIFAARMHSSDGVL